MSKHKRAKYLVIDTETTGLHPAKHGLIQVGALALDSKLEVVGTYVQDVRPPAEVEHDTEAAKIHGISQERIQVGMIYTDFCADFLKFVKKHFKTQPIAVGQFYPFDYAFLDYVYTISGYGSVMNKEIFSNKFIDTKSLALALNLKAEMEDKVIPFPVTSLSKSGGLKDTLGLVITDFQAHDALSDALATREVLIKLLEYLP